MNSAASAPRSILPSTIGSGASAPSRTTVSASRSPPGFSRLRRSKANVDGFVQRHGKRLQRNDAGLRDFGVDRAPDAHLAAVALQIERSRVELGDVHEPVLPGERGAFGRRRLDGLVQPIARQGVDFDGAAERFLVRSRRLSRGSGISEVAFRERLDRDPLERLGHGDDASLRARGASAPARSLARDRHCARARRRAHRASRAASASS